MYINCISYVVYVPCRFFHRLLHPANMHVTLLIIPLQTAVRAPAEELDLFHLKDQIRPETQTSKVTSHKVQGNLCCKCSAVKIYKYQGGEDRREEATAKL